MLWLRVDERLRWYQGRAWRSEKLRCVADVQRSDLRSTSGTRAASSFLQNVHDGRGRGHRGSGGEQLSGACSATKAAMAAMVGTIGGGGADSILACHRKMASGGVAK